MKCKPTQHIPGYFKLGLCPEKIAMSKFSDLILHLTATFDWRKPLKVGSSKIMVKIEKRWCC